MRTGLRLFCSEQKLRGCESPLNQNEKKAFPASPQPRSFVGIFAAPIMFPRKGKPSLLVPAPPTFKKVETAS